MSEENEDLARRFLEAQARGDTETLDGLMAPDFVDRGPLPGVITRKTCHTCGPTPPS